jgi:hypothetical protein
VAYVPSHQKHPLEVPEGARSEKPVIGEEVAIGDVADPGGAVPPIEGDGVEIPGGLSKFHYPVTGS